MLSRTWRGNDGLAVVQKAAAAMYDVGSVPLYFRFGRSQWGFVEAATMPTVVQGQQVHAQCVLSHGSGTAWL